MERGLISFQKELRMLSFTFNHNCLRCGFIALIESSN